MKKRTEAAMNALSQEKCAPCESNVSPLPDSEIKDLLKQLPGWTLHDQRGIPRLTRAFSFEDFRQALDFTDALGDLADEANHHPEVLLEYGRATVTWWTHNINGLHKNDFIMAAKTDALYLEQQK
jgi:4a-hydroxytetrahydrobiopterin dehydratase